MSAIASLLQVISTSAIVDQSGNPLVSGTITFIATDGGDNEIPLRIGAAGSTPNRQAIKYRLLRTISNGTIQGGDLFVANPLLTSPPNVLFRITINDLVGGSQTVYRGVHIVGLDNNTWNLADMETGLTIPTVPTNIVAGPKGDTGEQGAQGIPGAAGTISAGGVNGPFNVGGLLAIGGTPISAESATTIGYLQQNKLGTMFDRALSYAQNALNLNQVTFFNGKRGWRAGPIYGVYIADFALAATQFPEFFSATLIRDMLDMFYLYAKGSGDPHPGALPAFIDANGYNPGYLSGEPGRTDLPVGDPNWFMPLLEKLLFQKTGDISHFAANASALEASIRWTPINPTNGLVQNTSSIQYDAWLFQEILQDLGDMVIPSLFYLRASKTMADLYASAGNAAAAAIWTAALNKGTPKLNTTSALLWNGAEGMFFHATTTNVQTDIVGSSLAAYLTVVEGIPVCSPSQLTAISTYLNARWLSQYTDPVPIFRGGYAAYTSNPANLNAWANVDSTYAAGQYQNGGYWSVGNRWIQEALRINSPINALQFAQDHISRKDPHLEWFAATGPNVGTSPNLESFMGTFGFLRANIASISGSPPWMNGLIEAGGSRGVGTVTPDMLGSLAIGGENDHRVFNDPADNRTLRGVSSPTHEETVYQRVTKESWDWVTDFSVVPATRRLMYQSAPGVTPIQVLLVTPTGIQFGVDLAGINGPFVVDGLLKILSTGSSSAHFVGQATFGGDAASVIAGEFNGAAAIGGNNHALTAWTDFHIQPAGTAKAFIGSFGSVPEPILTIDNNSGSVTSTGSIGAPALILPDTNGHTYSYASVGGVLTPTEVS